MSSFTDRFGGVTVYPSEVGYLSYSLTTSTQLQWPEIGDTGSNLAAAFIRASSTVTGAGFIFPDARDISPGRAGRIRNTGSIAIPVFSTSGSTIATISAGQDYLISNIDNTTSGGLWDTEQLGVGTSSADANFLAGNGLTVSGSTLTVNWPTYFTGSNGFQLTTTANGVVNTWTGGTGTMGIKFDVGTARNGWITAVKNNGTGILTITGDGFDTVDGSFTQLAPNDSTFIVSAGTLSGFYTLGLSTQNTNTSFTVQLNDAATNNTLTNAQAANNIFILTGAIYQGGSTVIFPQTAGEYIIINQATLGGLDRSGLGSGYVSIATSAGNGKTVNIPLNSTRTIVSDGTNIYFADDLSQNRPAQNFIYWADFSRNPWQRGLTFTASSVTQYGPDRVSFNCASGANYTVKQVASTNTGSLYDLQIQRISGTSGGGQIVVGFDLDAIETFPLRGTTPTLAMQIRFGSSAQEVEFTAAVYTSNGNARIVDSLSGGVSTWSALMFFEEISLTTNTSSYNVYVVDPVSYNNNTGGVPTTASQLSVLLSYARPTGTADGNDSISISKLSLTPRAFSGFETVDVADVLNRCQKYAYALTSSSAGQAFGFGQAISGSAAIVNIPFPITMRKAPAISATASAWQLTTSTGAPAVCNGLALSGVTDYSAQLTISTTTSLLTAGNATMFQASTSTAAIVFSADL